MFRLFALKPFVSLLFVVSLFAFAPEAQATCMVRCSGKLIFEDCSAPVSPNTWPANLQPTFQVDCETCCSPPGGPLQCSGSSFNVTDFVLRDAQGKPLPGKFGLLAKTCNNKLSIQYSQTLTPAKGYDLLSSVPGGGNLILLQFDVVSSSQESPAEHSSEVIPDPEGFPEHSEVIPDPEGFPEHREAGNPDDPVHDNDLTDTPPTDAPPTDRNTEDGGPDAVPDACGAAPDGGSSDDAPRDGCGPTSPPDNPPVDKAPSDNAPSDNANNDNAPSDNANNDNASSDNANNDKTGGWSCEATSPAPTGLFFLLFGLIFLKRRRSASIA
ncbi:hypothetical protein L6R29_08555 [Myxococcota bacterium]|nr:hypothetical protein [Myxococcota bacterium]